MSPNNPKTLRSSGLNEKDIQSIANIFKKFPNIERAVLYGSRSKGNFKPGSDIDLTLIGKCIRNSELLQIENELDDLLLPYKIDLSLFHQIDNRDLIDHIEHVGILFYLPE